MPLEMVVAGLTVDPVSNAPIVILREKQSDRVLPIWIGVIEASAIAFELEKVKLTRPMAHDLMRTAISELGGTLERVAIVDLRDNTYFAAVFLTQNGRTIELDARPSDAIALALRAGAPIFCEASVLERATAQRAPAAEPQKSTGEEEVDRGDGGPKPIVASGHESFRELLESLEPEAFGKYKM